MAKDIPFDISSMIADYSNVSTLAFLRLVNHYWSASAHARRFRCIYLRVGNREDVRRYMIRLEELSVMITGACTELQLRGTDMVHQCANDKHETLLKDLKLVASQFGANTRTLLLLNWAGIFHIGQTNWSQLRPIQDLQLPRLFPAIRSFQNVSAYPYCTEWLIDTVSSWPALDHPEVLQRTSGTTGLRYICNNGLITLKMQGKDRCELRLRWLLDTPSIITLVQTLNLGVHDYDNLLAVIRFAAHPSNRVRNL
jgi:hypothetical protein